MTGIYLSFDIGNGGTFLGGIETMIRSIILDTIPKVLESAVA